MPLFPPKRSAFAFCLLLMTGMTGFAQVIPQERRTNWTLSGIRDTAVAPTLLIDFGQTGGTGDGLTENDEAFQQVIETVNGESAVLYFPKGNYLFTKPLNLPSNFIIRGAGSDSTKLIFNLETEDHLIKIAGKPGDEKSKITSGLLKDSYTIDVANASFFKTGDYIRISDNDVNLVTSEWAFHYSGQIVRIANISGNTLLLASPIRRDYSLVSDPTVQRLIPAKHTGIENIGIIRLDTTKEQTSNIQFSYAVDCWVKCIESERCNFAHVEINHSTNIDVTGSYMHHAFAYGGGGQGYGVALQYTSGECRIQNSIFNSLRHSILLQAGANGNVISYNHSVNPTWDEFPSNRAGDIVLHGNYPYANLFEGNAVQNIVVDNSHGKNGMYNTFFRNRAALYGIIVSDNNAQNLNLIGNEIPHSTLGAYFLLGSGHLQYGNNKSGKILPSGTDSLSEKSLYLAETPDYYERRVAWPPVGAPNKLNSHKIQAEDFYLSGFFTPCLAPLDTFGDIIDTTHQDTGSTDTTSFIREQYFDPASVLLYPNPAKNFVTVELKNSEGIRIETVRILSLLGQEMAAYRNARHIELNPYADGVYLVRIALSNGQSIVRKLVKGS